MQTIIYYLSNHLPYVLILKIPFSLHLFQTTEEFLKSPKFDNSHSTKETIIEWEKNIIIMYQKLSQRVIPSSHESVQMSKQPRLFHTCKMSLLQGTEARNVHVIFLNPLLCGVHVRKAVAN